MLFQNRDWSTQVQYHIYTVNPLHSKIEVKVGKVGKHNPTNSVVCGCVPISCNANSKIETEVQSLSIGLLQLVSVPQSKNTQFQVWPLNSIPK